MKQLLLLVVTLLITLATPLQADTIESPQGAKLTITSSPEHDFGEAKQKGGDLIHEFEFINDGSSPLVITRTVTGCSCVKVDYPKRPVAAGDKGKVKVTYEIHKKEKGSFSKIIQLYSNASPSRTTVTILGESK